MLFLLDEVLSHIQLCALHMEMRNVTEQLLTSIGLLAYKIDSLKEANDALKCYGLSGVIPWRLYISEEEVWAAVCYFQA